MKIYEKIQELENKKKDLITLISDPSTDKAALDYLTDQLGMINFTLQNIQEIDVEDDSFFDVDEYINKVYDDNTMTEGSMMYDIQRRILLKIEKIKNKVDSKYLLTNGNIASFLQDLAGYTLNPDMKELKPNSGPFPVGNIGDLSIFINPYMKWNDNRILFFKEKFEELDGWKEPKAIFTIKDSRNVLA